MRTLLLSAAFIMAAQAWCIAQDAPSATSSANSQDASARSPEQDREEFLALYGMFAEAVAQVELNYARPVDRRALFESALQGMLKDLDPYSRYIEPERFARYQAEIRAQRDGVGLELGLRDEQIVVRGIVPGSPSAEQGVSIGWQLKKINGEAIEAGDLAASEAQLEQSMEAGSVSLTFATDSSSSAEATQTVLLEATKIRQPTILPAVGLSLRQQADPTNAEWAQKSVVSEEPKIGQLTITTFGTATASDLETACRQLIAAGSEGLILDLRFNAGGLLQSAVDVADLFLESGKILSTQGRTSKPREWRAEAKGTLPDIPLVVLINGYSASASEVVAACLQDHGRATLVGSRTWGKGSVQNVVELEGGKSGLKLTTALYQRPSGTNIHRFASATEEDAWGVTPELADQVPLNDSQRQELLAARRLLLRGDSDAAAIDRQGRLKDPQQQRAIEVLEQQLRAASE